jgi:hypothetical protein
MADATSAADTLRDWRFVALVGCLCFLLSFAFFYYAAPLDAWRGAAAETPFAAAVASLVMLLAVLGAGILVTSRLQVNNSPCRPPRRPKTSPS